MPLRLPGTIAALVAGLVVVGLAASAAGQKVIEQPLRSNPYRNLGGSCIYGAGGQLVFSPQGANCPKLQQEASPSASLSAQMAERVRELFSTHPHIADEIVKVRAAIEADDRKGALDALDHVLGEVSANKAASERLVAELSRQK